MLLENKNAVIYGAAGGIGKAVARGFAREGAKVFLAGRTPATLDALAAEIRAAGGQAETAQVDALDEQAVDTFVDGVAAKAGSVDITMNLIHHGDVHGTPLAEMSLEDFAQPVTTAVKGQFLTMRAAARHMIRQRSGVVLIFGGTAAGSDQYPNMGGSQVAYEALEGMRRQWACELGPQGIRVVTLRTGGIPETMPEGIPNRDEIIAGAAEPTMLKRTATLEDVGNVAAFVASDKARSMTATDVNISCGAIVD